MAIDALIDPQAELAEGGTQPAPIALSTRVRLARNLEGVPFPGWAKTAQRETTRRQVTAALTQLDLLDDGYAFAMEDLDALEKQVLVERRLVSRELTQLEQSAVVVSQDQKYSVMINEEDHLRVQVVRSGLDLEAVWAEATELDSALEATLDYAFSSELGYLTACPTNVGTGLRASAMLHLPALVMQEHMDKVVRMVNQLGMAVRGIFGEGSEATGSIFQISNQQTLGESEEDIIRRLNNVIQAIIEQENNAREVILDQKQAKLLDKTGRAYGVLKNGHLLSSEEAMNLISLLRLAVDLGLLPDDCRGYVDRLFIESQPGHIQYRSGLQTEAQERDLMRARYLRGEMQSVPPLNYAAATSS